jgi:hypothetical protein
MPERIAGVVVLCALALAWSLAAPPVRTAPQRCATAQAEPWMADCLPGIGPARRVAAAAAIRLRDHSALPRAARPAVADLFADLLPDQAP